MMPYVHESQINRSMLTSASSIIGGDVCLIMEIKISFEPLNKLKVVLILRFAEFFYVDVFLDFAFGKGLL